jgi:hypothetical protein
MMVVREKEGMPPKSLNLRDVLLRVLVLYLVPPHEGARAVLFGRGVSNPLHVVLPPHQLLHSPCHYGEGIIRFGHSFPGWSPSFFFFF